LNSCRAVFDTNVFLSALMFGGPPEVLVRAARAGQIRLVISPQILAGLAGILKKKFEWDDEDIGEAILAVGRHADLVKPKRKISVLADDPDNRILECAVEGKADYIVSGDRQLLRLKRFGGIAILGASELLSKLQD
jgi:putative PIN family toxin of toxin-antitoxin system